MARISSLQKAGILVSIVSVAGGSIGTVWSIYSSFSALEEAENAGIGAVGDQIMAALLCSAGGLVGAVIGAVLLLGISKSNAK